MRRLFIELKNILIRRLSEYKYEYEYEYEYEYDYNFSYISL